jgi:CheY-like chemotaxis protein
MLILIVEDKYPDYMSARQVLEQQFNDVTFYHLLTELDFQRWLRDEAAPLPDLIVLDNMLPWTEPSPDMEPEPEELAKAGRLNAGLRCYELLRAHPGRSHIPVIMLTILSIACPVGAECVHKNDRRHLGTIARDFLGRRAAGESRGE